MGGYEGLLLKRCCCCGSLRTGTLIVGIGTIILSIPEIVMIALSMCGNEILNDQINMHVLHPFLSKLAIQIILIVSQCMTIILSILLVVGTIKRNFNMMMPWLVLEGILIIVFLVSVIIRASKFYTNDNAVNGTLWLILGVIEFLFFTYMWLVAFSFYYQESKKLKEIHSEDYTNFF